MDLNIYNIRQLLKSNKVQWRGHILIRMHQRKIKIKDVIDCVMSGEIIEYYESDYPFPSCLILGFNDKKKGIHVVCAVGQGYVWMITTYYPDSGEWYEDLRTRRR
ncbi:MAG: DUF4258 domain-containing protein [Clostridium sp.]|uniref:DUF4258 domain-containing protein n=1 Tax=Clostridium sp. TaxID=1506 RepID=UPI0025BA87AC|nr:DUF4258 domain-containing protein [Clostridium sp.]MCH3965527.1 DUF4258 domain-containing protein [Clostridium sp.]MCI1716856.1 DUF4258 domain-containing protein [Clostridium sp.]MCI1801214.1 DUF4258 domain-containing protein [Clostridium sp.]MCI1815042.1 DUF4258 domain-containing protein [Clostridium sp.]MCI1871943.1 DUF4258 domain-containing protein [Clostridium sp.]